VTSDEQLRSKTARDRAIALASAVLTGEADLVEVSRELWSRLGELGLDWDDVDYHALGVIASETDHLPIGAERANWDPEALARKDPEVRDAYAWAEEIGLPACERVVARFSRPS